MRLKVKPGDFRVREELSFPENRDGRYYVHVLSKQKLDTQQALSRVAKLAGVSRESLAFAGLKDRQGQTEQWISIDGRRLDHKSSDLSVLFKGRSDQPVSSKLSTGNSFNIVVRDLTDEEARRIEQNAPHVVRDGLPNYFDDQRFGCLRHGQGFVMRDVLRGDFEAALRGLLAQPSPKAITGDVKLKRILAKHWGDWEVCGQVARGPVFRRLFRLLSERGDAFREGLELLPTRMVLIHAFAFQSAIWNRAVDQLLVAVLPRRGGVRLPTQLGPLLAWFDKLDDEMLRRLENMRTPLYGPGGDGGDPGFRHATEGVLSDEQLTQADFQRNRVSGMVLREEDRALVVRPQGFSISSTAPDEAHRGRKKLELRFGLPRGSYATLVVKRLMAAPRRNR